MNTDPDADSDPVPRKWCGSYRILSSASIIFSFQVVGSSLGSLDLAGSEQTIYETPYSLLDNISPAYRSQTLTLPYINGVYTSVLDPDSPGSAFIWRSWIRIQEHRNLPKFSNKPGFLPFKKAFLTFVGMFFDLFLLKYIFHVKIQIFVT